MPTMSKTSLSVLNYSSRYFVQHWKSFLVIRMMKHRSKLSIKVGGPSTIEDFKDLLDKHLSGMKSISWTPTSCTPSYIPSFSSSVLLCNPVFYDQVLPLSQVQRGFSGSPMHFRRHLDICLWFLMYFQL